MRGYILPKKLLLGAASAAAQIEGGDVRHSWRDWEDMGRLNHESSFAQACDHWVRWKEDADIMAAMGLETYRLGIEWARIEPGPGCFDREAIRHYREEITYIKDRGIIPCLTLLHFTLPDWFEALGGFRDPANVKYFLRYVGIAVKSFGDLVSDYVTINEPNVFAYMGYAGQGWPPGEESIKAVFRVLSVMAGCHIRAYQRIHRMRRRMGLHDTKVGMALHMRAFAPMNSGSAFQKQSVRISRWYFQDIAARAFLTGRFTWPMKNFGGFEEGVYCDYLGINYYTRNHVIKPGDDLLRPGYPSSDYSWEIYPQGLTEVMNEIYRICRKPIWILENGICDDHDSFRSLYIYDQLSVIAGSDLPVERYYHWAFTDNFEWLDGVSKRFGLVHIDYDTFRRTVKKSGQFYREIIGSHGVTQEMAERYVEGEAYHR